jgi:predicted nucleic acid-binding protein
MPTVLVDTAAWIALVNTNDELHSRAEQTMADLRRRNVALISTEFVSFVANLCTILLKTHFSDIAPRECIASSNPC